MWLFHKLKSSNKKGGKLFRWFKANLPFRSENLSGCVFVNFIRHHPVSEFDGGNVHQIVDDGINGQTGGRMYLQLLGNVAAMGDDGIDGYAQMVGDFLVGHSLHQAHDDIFLPVAQHVFGIGILIDHVGDFHADIILLRLGLQTPDYRYKDVILHLGVHVKPVFIIINIV